jgi:hypothetical protein
MAPNQIDDADPIDLADIGKDVGNLAGGRGLGHGRDGVAHVSCRVVEAYPGT